MFRIISISILLGIAQWNSRSVLADAAYLGASVRPSLGMDRMCNPV
jgi:hypothetical protein